MCGSRIHIDGMPILMIIMIARFEPINRDRASHRCLSAVSLRPSWPAKAGHPRTSLLLNIDVDARDKRGHDGRRSVIAQD